MRVKLDENMPSEAIESLLAAGHDAHSVHQEALSGAPDQRLAEMIRVEGRALVTLDLDFANLRAYPPADFPGLIVLRPAEPSRDSILALLRRVTVLLENESPNGALWIVSPSRVRIRKK